MNLLSDFGSLISKYGGPVATYAFSFVGLNLGDASGQVNAGVSTAAVAALFPAVIHLGVDVVNDLRGLVKVAEKDIAAVKAAADAAAQPPAGA